MTVGIPLFDVNGIFSLFLQNIQQILGLGTENTVYGDNKKKGKCKEGGSYRIKW